MDTPNLTLPHPRIAERQFVLRPLADIRLDCILPNFPNNISETLGFLKNEEKINQNIHYQYIDSKHINIVFYQIK